MAYELLSWLVGAIKGNTAIATMLGRDSDGNYSVFPYHSRSGDTEAPFPRVTVARFGSGQPQDRFNQSAFANLMDDPRIAICVWDQTNIEKCWRIYRLIDPMLRGANPQIANQYFGAFKAMRTVIRDDLFDETLKAFHLHTEYTIPIQLVAGVAQA